MPSIKSLHLVALGESISQRVLITLGDYRHLTGLVLVETVEHHLEIVQGLQSLACEGICAHPRRRITKDGEM